VDGPSIQSLPRPELHDVSGRIYIRLHGRNAEQWWNGGQLRYDYLYPKPELNDWIWRIKHCKSNPESIHILFNNCHMAKAVQNAKMMKELIDIEVRATTNG